MKTSILLPTTGRPEKLQHCLGRIRDTTKDLDVEVICVVDVDEKSYEIAKSFDRVTAVFNENYVECLKAYNQAAAMSSGDYIIPMADDQICYPGWLEKAISFVDKLPESCGIVGINDRYWNNGEPITTVWLATRCYVLKYMGGCIVAPCYRWAFADTEALERSKNLGRYVYCPESVVEHRHWTHGTAQKDSTYSRSDGWLEIDGPVYSDRKAKRFPIDFDPVMA